MADVVPLTDEEVAERLRQRAAEGYDTDQEIVSSLVEEFMDEHGPEAQVAARVERLSKPVFEARAAEERSWPVPTDCDRLDRAFAALNAGGIVARQNFTCCQTCGHAEIGAEFEACPVPVRGYAFFHVQDTEHAAEGYGLCLAYGAVLPDEATRPEYEAAVVGVGHEIVAALRAEGLAPAWEGDRGKRIELPLTWRRRRPRR